MPRGSRWLGGGRTRYFQKKYDNHCVQQNDDDDGDDDDDDDHDDNVIFVFRQMCHQKRNKVISRRALMIRYCFPLVHPRIRGSNNDGDLYDRLRHWRANDHAYSKSFGDMIKYLHMGLSMKGGYHKMHDL